jgi:hypothetical protein
MTLDEYMAGGIEHYQLQHEDACNMLDDAIGRITDLTADRDNWRDQCMDARREWEAVIADRDSWMHAAVAATEGMRNVEARRWGAAGE